MKCKYAILLTCCLVLLTGCTRKSDIVIEKAVRQEEANEPETSAGIQPEEEETNQLPTPPPTVEIEGAGVQEPEYIYIHICGEVKNPGVYRMERDSRVYQAVEAAGGFLAGANEGYVNQSRGLEDGMKIWIPSLLEKPETMENMSGDDTAGLQAAQGNPAQQEGGLVNLNTATVEQLCTLPGIGESRARLIVEYREKTGRFNKIEDIMKIEGIKEGSFAKLKDRITV